MKLCLIIKILLLHIVSDMALPVSNTLTQFLESAFENSISSVYLVGLENRKMFETILRLSNVPKIIVDAERNLGVLDGSCLVVMFVDMQNQSLPIEMIQSKFSNVSRTPWSTKVLVLVENQFFDLPSTINVLDFAFRKNSIFYWAVTPERDSSTVKYTIHLAGKTTYIEGAMNFQTVYTYRRLETLDRVSILAQWEPNFPFTYKASYKTIAGIDYLLFTRLFEYLHVEGNIIKADNRSLDPKYVAEAVKANLESGKMDLTITRSMLSHETRFPMIVLPEQGHLIFVVPRETKITYFDTLLRPFSCELWITIACAVVLFHVASVLGRSYSRFGSLIKRMLQIQPSGRLLQISANILCFILVESYLAQVTSYLLVHRFHPDPETVEELLATNISISLTKAQLWFVEGLATSTAKSVLQRASIVSIVIKLSKEYAYLDTPARGSYVINLLLKPDPATGRQSSFILREPFGSFRTSYRFAPRAIALRDYFAINLAWVRAFGFVKLADRLYTQVADSVAIRAVFTDDLIGLEHMVPFWMALAFGWVAAVVVLFAECCVTFIGSKLR